MRILPAKTDSLTSDSATPESFPATELPIETGSSSGPEPAMELPQELEGNSLDGIGTRALRGAAFLFGREAAGSVVRLMGTIITVRAIGPSEYGIYTAAAAFVAVVVTVAQMGSEVYLIRVRDTPTARLNNEVFTLLFVTSAVASLLCLGFTFAFPHLLRPVGVLWPLRILLLSVPINVLWAPAQARIERAFNYMKMGLLEFGGDCVLYGTAIPLAILKFGAWSLVAGYIAWQSFLLIGSLIWSGLRPRFAWSSATAREVARHGFTYSSSTFFTNVTASVNPIVVGSLVGAAGVGYVSLAQSLVTTIGFAKRSAYRLGIVTMSKITHGDRSLLPAAIARGGLLMTLGLAVPFMLFGLGAHWIIPFVFGHAWSVSIPVYSLLSLASLLGALAIIEMSVFYAWGRNTTVTAAAALQAAVLTLTALLFVHLWGFVGFGVASVVALLSRLYLDRQLRKTGVRFPYREIFIVTAITAPSMFLPVLPLPLGVVLLAPWILFLIVPQLRREALSLTRTVWGSLRGRVL